MNITLDEIRSKAPNGATHYYRQYNKVIIYFIVQPDGSQKKVTPSYGHKTWEYCDYKLSKLIPLN